MRSHPEPKIAVVGAGAVGSVIGALLARAGADVTLIARQEHVRAIENAGLWVDGALGEFTVNLQAATELDFSPDLALLTVKTQDLRAACQAIKPYVQGVPVVTLQNGVRGDEIAASCLGQENVVGGVVIFNARFLQPGRVTYSVPGSLLLGEALSANGQRVQEIQAVLNQAIETKICPNIHGAHWTKLLVNSLGNSLEAMTGFCFRECLKHRALSKIGICVVREGLDVVKRANIQLASLPRLPLFVFKAVFRSPLPLASMLLNITTGSLDNTLTSTLQSLRRGRPTEIDFLNGEIVALGQRVQVATPYNSRVVELVHQVEQNQQFYSPASLERYFLMKL
jgi:2-dehydropantoate 2-reductase